MTEYITKEAAVEAIDNAKDIASINPITRHNAIFYALEAVPAADVVEVVRCKDCEHRTEETDRQGYYLCKRKMLGLVGPTSFCSFGERRE